MKIKLIEIAHGRSGDKGDAANVGIIAYDDLGYQLIKKHLTIEKEFVSERLNDLNFRIFVR